MIPHSSDDFDDFYREHYPRLVRFAGKLFPGLDEEEIAQETLTRVCEHFDSLHPDKDPWPFITQIARRIAFDAYRRRSRFVAVDSTAITALVEDVAPPADCSVMDSETRLELARAMDSLSGEHRRILRWRVIEGRSSAEIAEELGITPNAARQKVFRACKALTTAYFRVVPGVSVVFGLAAAIRRLSRKLRPGAGGAGAGGSALLAAAATLAVVAGTAGTLIAIPDFFSGGDIPLSTTFPPTGTTIERSPNPSPQPSLRPEDLKRSTRYEIPGGAHLETETYTNLDEPCKPGGKLGVGNEVGIPGLPSPSGSHGLENRGLVWDICRSLEPSFGSEAETSLLDLQRLGSDSL